MILIKREHKVGFKYGMILGLIVVLIGIIRYRTGMIFNGDQRLSYLYWVIFFMTNLIVVIHFNRINKSSIWRTIKIGLIIGFISSFIYLLYLIALNYFIDPALPEKLVEALKQKMLLQNPELTPNQIKEIELMKSTSNPAIRGLIYIFVCSFFGMISSWMGWMVLRFKTK